MENTAIPTLISLANPPNRIATPTAHPAPNTKLRPRYVSWLILVSVLLGLGSLGVLGWKYLSNSLAPERSITYWLTVQRMYDSKALGTPFDATGRDYFHTGDKFVLNIVTNEPGALYMINEGRDEKGTAEWNILFPTKENNQGEAQLSGQQTVKTGSYFFTGTAGVEQIWIVWSAHESPLLKSIFHDAINDGVVRKSTQLMQLQDFFKQNESTPTELIQDEAKARALLKGRGEILVRRLDLSHKHN